MSFVIVTPHSLWPCPTVRVKKEGGERRGEGWKGKVGKGGGRTKERRSIF
jgi:hypothetical protein